LATHVIHAPQDVPQDVGQQEEICRVAELRLIYWISGISTWLQTIIISQLGGLFPIYGKIKNVPNHQPDIHVEYQLIY